MQENLNCGPDNDPKINGQTQEVPYTLLIFLVRYSLRRPAACESLQIPIGERENSQVQYFNSISIVRIKECEIFFALTKFTNYKQSNMQNPDPRLDIEIFQRDEILFVAADVPAPSVEEVVAGYERDLIPRAIFF